MSSDSRSTEIFLSHLKEDARAPLSTLPGLCGVLDRLTHASQQSFPEFSVDAMDFLPFLARHVGAERASEEGLLSVRAGDLYLLCACRRRDPRALAVLSERYLSRVEAALLRLGVPAQLIEDVKQNVCQRLLGEELADVNPAHYAGRGALVGWLCVTAVREARYTLRRDGHGQPLEEKLIDGLAADEGDQEMVYLRTLYQGEFKAAFQEALASLEVRERNLMRYHFLDGLSIDQVGALHRVHRATAARWMAKVRKRLLLRTRQALMKRIRVDRSDLESILRLIQSQLDVSIHRLLQEER